MKEKKDKLGYMPNKIVDIVLIVIPIVGVLLKNLFYLGFLLGNNYYQINLSNAFTKGGVYLYSQLGIITLLLLPAVFFKGKGKYWYLLAADLFFSLLAVIDICYARFFNDLPSISMLKIVNLSNDSVASSGNALLPIIGADILFFVDFIVWLAVFLPVYIVDVKKKKPKTARTYSLPKRGIVFGAVGVVCAFMLAILPVISALGGGKTAYANSYATHDARTKSVAFTPFGYHMYDIGDSLTKKKLTSDKEALIKGYFEWNASDYYIDDKYFGKFEGKNVVVLQLESFETFLIGNSVDGQELTPNLNALISKSYFFDNIYDQVSCGNSSDCDFMVNTSLYPSSGVSAYNFFSHNTYRSTPMILADEGYKTSYFNSLKNSFWNYYPMNKDCMKFEVNDYEFDLTNKIYQYISDESYLSQLADKIIALQTESDGPVYSHTTTDSSHGPFRLPDECCTLTLNKKLSESAVGDYLQAVHYADSAVGGFLRKMEESPEYNNTVFVFVGDHRGIHKYYPQEVNKFKDDELPDFIKRNFDAGIPLIIFDPSMPEGSGEKISTYGGQTDLAPTLLYLLGVPHEDYKDYYMGRCLLATSRNVTFSSDGILRGEASEEDLYWIRQAYYISDYILETDYFKGCV